MSKVSALDAPDILIVELQVRSGATSGAADQEFVKLYNASSQTIDVSAWKLQYKSATGSSWGNKATMHGLLGPHSYYLLVSDKYLNPPAAKSGEPALALDVFNAGLSDTAGHVRIVDATIQAVPLVHDTLGWGFTANAAEGNAPVAAPGGGKSLKRRTDQDGLFVDNDNNLNDFEIASNPAPQADPLYTANLNEPNSLTLPPNGQSPVSEQVPHGTDPSAVNTDTMASAPTANSVDSVTQNPPASAETEVSTPVVVLSPPNITELLPNPAAPASDSTDEFIELYNPNDQPFLIEGYKLQSGTNFSYSYTFPAITLEAHQYKAFMVTQTSDILANSGGRARLLDTSGGIVAVTDPYNLAVEGQAWALIEGSWAWTITPTPGQPNILALASVAKTSKPIGISKPSASAKPSPSKTVSKPSPAKTSVAKVAPTKSSGAKTAATKATKAPAKIDRQAYQPPAAAPATIHPGILAGVGLITILYAAYEYRHDAVNLISRLRRYREVRRSARQSSAGR